MLVVTGMVTVRGFSITGLCVTGLSGPRCVGAPGGTDADGVTSCVGASEPDVGGATTEVPPPPAPPGPPAGDVVVVVVIAWVVVVVVAVDGGVVVIVVLVDGGVLVDGSVVVVDGVVVLVGVPLIGGGSGTGELDVGALVVNDEVAVSDDDVAVSDDDGVELPGSDDVVEPGATTAGSGIAGGGTPGGRVALGSFASTFTVRSCHWVTSCCF